MKTILKILLFISVIFIAFAVFFIPRHVEGTGGTFPNTEHGGTDATYPDRGYYPITDNVTGVSRGHLDAYYSTDYNRGECVHCHEPHASYVGQEPVPNWSSHGLVGEGPDQFMLFADYSSKSTRVDFCGYCHTEEDPDANGNPFDTPSDYSFQGATKFKSTAHYQPQFGRNPAQWPGGSRGSTYPAKSSSDSGTCVNCHSPHGYPYSSSDVIASSGTPYPKQLVELTDINNKNPGTSPITTWPNVAGRDPDDAEDLCYTCHISSVVQNKDLATYNSAGTGYTGTTGIYEAFQQAYHHPVKDSEQVGKTSYYQANPAKPMDIHFAVECTTCHNPHLASGRWDDASSAWPSPTPVVLPGVTKKAYQSGLGAYDWPPTSWGLSYQPGDLWGDDPEEKINALLQRFSGRGTGGWQFNINRGYPEGATNMPFDQYAKYQPPLGGTGSGYQPDGDALPDYLTFCLDCHQHKVGTHLPIYWGASFPPGVDASPSTGVTGEGVEPHGFDAANTSPFGCCDAAGWKVCDDIDTDTRTPFYGEPRGRGYDVFTRWPYEMADRIAGINYVLACTDCHEPHGSGNSGLIRNVINGSNWSSSNYPKGICNSCHWDDGGEMLNDTCGSGANNTNIACGSASCHEQNSLHRIKKNNQGASTLLYAKGCPNDPVTFDMSGANDTSGKLQGTAYNGALSGGWFKGNGKNNNSAATYIKPNSDGYHTCLLGGGIYSSGSYQYASTMTLETRIDTHRTGTYDPNNNGLDTTEDYPIGYSTSTYNDSNWRVIFSRHDAVGVNYSLQFFRPGVPENTTSCTTDTTKACYPGFASIPDRRASIAFKVVYYSTTSPNWYDRLIVTDFTACPVTNDHYYKIRVVYDKDASVSGHAPPGNIYMDDQGTDGNGAGELWTGFRNCTDADQSLLTVANTRCCPTCLYTNCAFSVGDKLQVSSTPDSAAPSGCKRAYAIGLDSSYNGINYYSGSTCSPKYTKVFNGSIDYITIQNSADYSGITNPNPP